MAEEEGMSNPIEIIKCKQLDYKGCEIIEGEPDYLALFPTHVEHKWKFSAKLQDPDSELWIEKSFIGICTIPKSQICYTTAGFTHDKEMYHIQILSVRDEIILVVDSMKEARAIHKTLTDWLYS